MAALISMVVIGAAIDRDWSRMTQAEIPPSRHRDLSLENVRQGHVLSVFVVIHQGRGPFHSAIIQPDNTTLYEKEFYNRDISGTVAQISGVHILRVSNPSSAEALAYIGFRIQPSSWMPIELMFLLFVTITSLPVLISGSVYRQYKTQRRQKRGLSAIFSLTLLFAILSGFAVVWHYWFVEEISHAVLVNDRYDYIPWALATYVLIILLREKRQEAN